MNQYILGFDQSTQGTKAMLFDGKGRLLMRQDLPHEQIINEQGWVSHNPEEIYKNVVETGKLVIRKAKIDANDIVGISISNQRETSVAWNRKTGKPYGNAIVWQCSRATEQCQSVIAKGMQEKVKKSTGMPISPYFPASKYAWILENEKDASKAMQSGELCLGTIDSWLVFNMTDREVFATDYSNASRTQLFNIYSLKWDDEIARAFGIDTKCLPEVKFSDSYFGDTDLSGILPKKVPIHGVMGDSHGALLGQGCIQKGMVKTTYGTGSSIMMNIGEEPIESKHGLVTSLAWGLRGKVEYCLEGNLNYTGAVITWLKDNMKMICSAGETEELANAALKNDSLYLIPAFTGLGAPYWKSDARASFVGMDRTTGKNEIVRSALECIAYQIKDIVEAMCSDAGIERKDSISLRVDGGPTKNKYLMQFQSDILDINVMIPNAEELSGIGAAWAAGMALGIYSKDIFSLLEYCEYRPEMDEITRKKKYTGWMEAVERVIH